MTETSTETEALPPVPSWDRARQIRLLIIVAVVAIVLIVLGIGLRALLTPTPRAAETTPPGTFRPTADQLHGLHIEPVRVGENVDLLRASGSITADGDHSTPILLPYSGQVVKVMVEPGQRVALGQPLLEVASPELVDARNGLRTASAQEASAAKAFQVASDNLTRAKAIYQTAGGALKDYLQAQADYAAAQSALQAAQSATRASGDRLALFGKRGASQSGGEPSSAGPIGTAAATYRAPVAGIVADRSIAPGQFITAGNGSPLLTITDPSRVWLVAQLAEADAGLVHVGDQVTVTTPALPGRSFSATIDNIAAAIDPNTHRLPVRATIANPDGALKPAMFASFVIRRQLGGTGVLVPAKAVIHEGDGARVWVMQANGLLAGRSVTVGETEGGYTRILTGLAPGERVVTSGALFVNEAGLEE